MKDKLYTDIICKGFCKFYKEGKEEMHCGGYELLRKNLTSVELKELSAVASCGEEIKVEIPTYDEGMFELVCGACDFRIDGCDYSENLSGPPCGGYNFIRLVRKKEAQ